jgi:hypothetical protein
MDMESSVTSARELECQLGARRKIRSLAMCTQSAGGCTLCAVQTMPEGMDGVLLDTGRESWTHHPLYHVWNDEGEYTGECLRKKKGK